MFERLQHVDATSGSAVNSGQSWDQPTDTIANAVGNIVAATGTPEGGGVILSPEDHSVFDLDIDEDGVTILGLSRSRSRIRWAAGAAYALRFRGVEQTLTNLKMRPDDDTVNQDGIVLTSDGVATSRFFSMSDVVIQNVGWNYNDGGTPDAINVGPTAIRHVGSASGSSFFSDFHEIHSVRLFQNYRHVVFAGGGCNAFYNQAVLHASRVEAVYARRQEQIAAGASSAHPWFTQCWLVGDGNFQDGEYLVRLEWDTALGGGPGGGSDSVLAMFDRCMTEHSVANNGGHHFYVDAGQNSITAHRFGGGGDGAEQPTAVEFGPDSHSNIVTAVTREGRGGAGIPQFIDRGQGNSWPGSDGGVTSVVGPVVTGRMYTNEVTVQGESETGTMAADRLYFSPVRFSQISEVDQLAAEIYAVGVATDRMRIGLYSTGDNGMPGVLLDESAEIDVSAVGEAVYNLAADRALGANTAYWLGAVFNASVSVARLANDGVTGYGRNNATIDQPSRRFYATHTFGALPDPAPTTFTYETTGPPKLMVRGA